MSQTVAVAADLPSSEDELRAHQLRRLRAGLPGVLASNRFYRERLHDVRSWDDFTRLPFTTKAELVADQDRNPPFGTDLTHPLHDYVRLHQTSGSSGSRPLRWLDTAQSWAWWAEIWARHIYGAAGVTAADTVFAAFSFGPFIGFWSAYVGAERLGALVVPGGAMTSEQRVQAIVDVGATVLCCTPTYALRLAETAIGMGVDLADSAVRVTIHAGEPGASVAATKAAIESAFGARCHDHCGMTELGPTGFSCVYGGGLHLVETEFIFEVDRGELIATNLGRWGSPLIRYRTGDRVDLSREGCSCGSPFAKLCGGILGRVDDMFTVRGVNLYPSQVEDVVRRHRAVTEFMIEVRTVRQMDEVTLLFETTRADDLAPETLARELRVALGARIECRQVTAGTLPRMDLKSQRIRKVVL
jgi:phenylacetate-CoA ligase